MKLKVGLILAVLFMSGCSGGSEPKGPAIGNFDLNVPAGPSGDFHIECRSKTINESASGKRYLNQIVRVFSNGQEILESQAESEVPC